jgi:FkbM family methyltransferase
MNRLGFRPKIIVDVGVACGTDELYKAFPEAYFLLIEALKEYEQALATIVGKYRGSYIVAAAGAISGDVVFNVHDGHLEGSSLYKETMGCEADGHETRVRMLRLDDILKEKGLDPPDLIKIDVQGAELDVLVGAPQALGAAEAVVLEVSMYKFMQGAPEFYDIVCFMKRHGFVAYDIIPGWNRPLDGALGQTDIVFVKEKGRFRQNHSFA